LSPELEAPRVIARLPFGPRGNARSGDALAIGYGAQQESGQDRTLLATENAVEISRGRMFTVLSGLGLSCTFLASCQHAEAANTLIEVDGFVPLSDPRLGEFRAQLGTDLFRLLAVGGYALPLQGTTLPVRPSLSRAPGIAATANGERTAAES